MKAIFNWLYVLLFGTLFLVGCATYNYDSKINEINDSYSTQLKNIIEELNKKENDYIIFDTGIAFATSLQSNTFVFTRENENVIIKKYDFYGIFPNKVRIPINRFNALERSINAINQDSIIEHTENIFSYNYFINARLSNKYYYFETYSDATNPKIKNENLQTLVLQIKAYLFDLELTNFWGINGWGRKWQSMRYNKKI